ncbi:hypothetical protein PG995_013044 [Apiospora arundinis]
MHNSQNKFKCSFFRVLWCRLLLAFCTCFILYSFDVLLLFQGLAALGIIVSSDGKRRCSSFSLVEVHLLSLDLHLLQALGHVQLHGGTFGGVLLLGRVGHGGSGGLNGRSRVEQPLGGAGGGGVLLRGERHARVLHPGDTGTQHGGEQVQEQGRRHLGGPGGAGLDLLDEGQEGDDFLVVGLLLAGEQGGRPELLGLGGGNQHAREGLVQRLAVLVPLVEGVADDAGKAEALQQQAVAALRRQEGLCMVDDHTCTRQDFVQIDGELGHGWRLWLYWAGWLFWLD